MLYQFKLSSKQLFFIIKLLFALNTIMLIGTWAYNLDLRLRYPLNELLYEFNLASENVIAAWYSSMLLLLSSIMAFICFIIDKQYFLQGKERVLSFGWIIYALCFALLSFDELGSIHENIGDTKLFEEAGELLIGGKYAGWTVFTILIGIVGLFMIAFSMFRLKNAKWAFFFMIVGLLCYLSNPFQENFEIASYKAAPDPGTWKRPVFFTLLEEGTEIFGSLFFFASTITYALYVKRLPVAMQSKSANITITFMRKTASNLLTGVIILFILGMIVTEYLFGEVVADDQVGVPKNWLPSAVWFIAAMSSFCTINMFKRLQFSTPIKYFSAGLISLLLSVFYGCNMYASYLTSGGMLRRSILNIIFIVIAISAVRAFSAGKNRFVQMAVIASVILLYLSFFSHSVYAAELGLFASCIVLYNLMYNAFYINNWKFNARYSLQ